MQDRPSSATNGMRSFDCSGTSVEESATVKLTRPCMSRARAAEDAAPSVVVLFILAHHVSGQLISPTLIVILVHQSVVESLGPNHPLQTESASRGDGLALPGRPPSIPRRQRHTLGYGDDAQIGFGDESLGSPS